MTRQELHILQHWQENKRENEYLRILHDYSRNSSIDYSRNKDFKFLCDCSLNFINGNIPFKVDEYITYEKELRVCAQLRHQIGGEGEFFRQSKALNYSQESVAGAFGIYRNECTKDCFHTQGKLCLGTTKSIRYCR